MRRVAFLAVLTVTLLLIQQPALHTHGNLTLLTGHSSPPPRLLLPPSHPDPAPCPPALPPKTIMWREELGGSEEMVVAYATNISSLVHWQRVAADLVNATRQMRLLQQLASFESRHPFVEGGNASLDLLVGELEGMGLQVVEDWFPVVQSQWNGTGYVDQPFWTRNLYLCPWGVNSSRPSLVVTCHVDSARYNYIGLSPSPAPGANDDASGVAATVEALHVLKGFNLTGGWNVVFAFLGGEEGNSTLHLWGSRRLLENGLPSLGVNISTAMMLNIDEVGYKGLILPSRLAVYRYPGEPVEPLLETLLEAGKSLGIPLVDEGEPRVSTSAEVDSYTAWSTSEWTFHSQGVPSLTLSTDQYPDPYKHTTSDVASRCRAENLSNTSRLIAAVALSLAYQPPPSPPSHAAEWVSILSSSLPSKVVVVDYLNFTYSPQSAYHALILDSSLNVDETLAHSLMMHGTPILALGLAGAQLIGAATGTDITGNGVRELRARGLLPLHPALGYHHLLEGEAAVLLRNCSTVYAVKPMDHLLVMVGNSSWCSVGLYTGPPALRRILFLGAQIPKDQTITKIAVSGLNWLLKGSTAGLLLGVGRADPMVGDHTNLYAIACNFTTWTGFAGEEVKVNITGPMSWDNRDIQLVTNGTGVAELELWFRSPTQLEINASSGELQACLTVTPSPACSAEVEGVGRVLQGEILPLRCTIQSAWSKPERVNLALGSPAVGSVKLYDVLLMPGPNTYLLELEVDVGCPLGNHTLTLNITTPDLFLLYQHLQLEVEQAFTLSLKQAPGSIIQQTPFEVWVTVSNLGSKERVFDVQTEPGSGFHGSCRVIVAANQTLSLAVSIVYLPSTAIDVGMRQLRLELRLGGVMLCSIQVLLQVGYSTVNLLLSLLPYAALGAVCLIGVWWMRPSSRRSKRPRRKLKPPPPHRRFRYHLLSPTIPSFLPRIDEGELSRLTLHASRLFSSQASRPIEDFPDSRPTRRPPPLQRLIAPMGLPPGSYSSNDGGDFPDD